MSKKEVQSRQQKSLAETIERGLQGGWSEENIIESFLVEHPECTPEDVKALLRLRAQEKASQK